MVDIENAIKRVDPKKDYNISEMRMDNLCPWISGKNQSSYISAVLEDAIGVNLLKVKASGTGRSRRYEIKGKNIINYLTKKYHDTNQRD